MEELECGIEELYPLGLLLAPAMVPQMLGEPKYAWQYLTKQPYGAAIWDILSANGEQVVAFMARERAAEMLALPKSVDVFWKILVMAGEAHGHRVLPVIVLIYFIPSAIYEVWFNFYGAGAEDTQSAFQLLSTQPGLLLFFLDSGPEFVRKLSFTNGLKERFRGFYGMCKAMAPWSDADFNAVKRDIQSKYSTEDLLRMRS